MKEPLKFIGKDKEGNYIFRKASIVDVIIEASGLGILARALNMNIKMPCAWISKGDLKFIDEHGGKNNEQKTNK